MKLIQLLENLADYKILGSRKREIFSVTEDSRLVKKDSLFVAIKGLKDDGNSYIPQAVESGAKVIVCEKLPKYANKMKVTYIIVGNPRKALGIIASNFFGNPSQKMTVIGVTGTDGKTTTASLIYHILNSSGKKTGLITTLGAKIKDKLVDTGLHVTSPDAVVLHKVLSEMLRVKCEYAVLEVTSHGLDQERVAGVKFDYGVLTNITREHLDYHKSFEEYREAKSKLFIGSEKGVVLNKDDQSFTFIKSLLSNNSKLISYSVNDKNSNIYSRNIKENNGTFFEVVDGVQSYSLETNLMGIYNISNILAAIGICREFAISPIQIKQALKSFNPPPGRLEKLKTQEKFSIYIDFAHTPNALRCVLSLLRSLINKLGKNGRLISVFGCAGERDKGKREIMGEISARFADVSIFTAEDPRVEDVNNIINQMAKGALRQGAKEIKIFGNPKVDTTDKKLNNIGPVFFRVPEREEAIYFALKKVAKDNDIVVICGKGHEKSMAYDNVEHSWNDKEIVEMILGTDDNLASIVFAAGKGTRMKSESPKVLLNIAGKPMISYTVQNLRSAGFGKIILVVGYKREDLIQYLGYGVEYAHQKEQLGTGDALYYGMNLLEKSNHNVLAVNGDDSGFYNPQTFKDIYDFHIKNKNKVSFTSAILDDPFGIGRVIRNKKRKVVKIVEEKDTSASEKKIKEANIGLYVFDISWLRENIKKIKKSSTGEYYVVDLIKIAIDSNVKVGVFRLKDNEEWFGVNTPEQLKKADVLMRKKLEKRQKTLSL